MKKKIVSFIITGAVLGLGLSSVIFSPKKAVESQGYSTSDLPTTIDLNDTSASDIRSYYSSLNGLSTSERQGNNLLKNLKSILKNGQKYYAYDGTSEGKKIWQMYEIVDRDWSKSPASSISGYNSSTNVITGYSYGNSYSSPGTNPYLHALYVDRSVTNQMRAWKKDSSSTENNHGNNAEWYIDREHIWPKSQGFEAEGAGGARGDPMHLWPGDSDVNSIAHNNNFYGYVNTSSSYSVGKWSYAQNNYRGASLTLGSGDNVFEPQDADKGDIARAIFYMVARYNYLSGSDSDGIDTNNPNLALVQDNTVASSYTSSTSNTGKMGILTDLLAWHQADPVDQFEIHRNNLLFNNYTNNRNPFIDFPEWVDFIWGNATYNGRNYQSYSATPTGYATPSSDTINGYNNGGTPPTPVESGTEDNPYTVTEARAAIDASSTLSNKYTRGIVYQVDSYNSTYKSITYWISDDGTNTNGLQVYSGKGIGGANFSSISDIKIGDTVVVKGNLKKYNSTYEYDYNNELVSITHGAEATSITATPKKTFNVGETITTSDITVKDNLNNVITDFSFTNNNYQFQYSDAASGGSLTNKTFTNAITSSSFTCSLTVQVQRKTHEEGTISDTLDVEYTGKSGASTYSSWSSKAAPTSNAQYAGNNAGGNDSIQLRSNNSNSGIVSTVSGGTLRSVSVTWNSNTANARTLNVYGNNSAYSTPSDLYISSTQGTLLGTIVKGTSTSLTVTGSYTYVGICSAGNAMYLTDVTFVYEGEDYPENLANYIMFEDTNNQCVTKFDVAKSSFEGLTKAQRNTFMTSNDYVISTARTRLLAWANSLGKTITLSNGDYVISNVRNNLFIANDQNSNLVSIILVSSILLLGTAGVVACVIVRRKKQEN